MRSDEKAVGGEDVADEIEGCYAAIGPGWRPLVMELVVQLRALGWRGKPVQIKEKFGTLRFYVDGPMTDEQHKLVWEYEAKSYSICEDCGKLGKLADNHGWWRTTCGAHG